jgi:hypothetical protein
LWGKEQESVHRSVGVRDVQSEVRARRTGEPMRRRLLWARDHLSFGRRAGEWLTPMRRGAGRIERLGGSLKYCSNTMDGGRRDGVGRGVRHYGVEWSIGATTHMLQDTS